MQRATRPATRAVKSGRPMKDARRVKRRRLWVETMHAQQHRRADRQTDNERQFLRRQWKRRPIFSLQGRRDRSKPRSPALPNVAREPSKPIRAPAALRIDRQGRSSAPAAAMRIVKTMEAAATAIPTPNAIQPRVRAWRRLPTLRADCAHDGAGATGAVEQAAQKPRGNRAKVAPAPPPRGAQFPA